MAPTFRVALPMFVMVMACGDDAVPTGCVPKFNAGGLSCRQGPAEGLHAGTYRSHMPRPCVAARSVREPRWSRRPRTATFGSMVCKVVHVVEMPLSVAV